jgi:hypothetical protein
MGTVSRIEAALRGETVRADWDLGPWNLELGTWNLELGDRLGCKGSGFANILIGGWVPMIGALVCPLHDTCSWQSSAARRNFQGLPSVPSLPKLLAQ